MVSDNGCPPTVQAAVLIHSIAHEYSKILFLPGGCIGSVATNHNTEGCVFPG